MNLYYQKAAIHSINLEKKSFLKFIITKSNSHKKSSGSYNHLPSIGKNVFKVAQHRICK